MQSKTIRGYIFVILSAVIYGCMPLMAKHIYADGVNSFTLVFLRNALALPSLAMLTFAKHKTFKIPVKSLPKLSVLAFFGCCMTPILSFSSYNYIATGTATVFHFVYPSIVVLIGMVFLKKKVPFGTLASVLMCFAGICLFYNPAQPFDVRGGALALLSGVTFAIYVVLLSNFNHGVSGMLLSFYVATISSVLTLIICVATGSLALPSSWRGWLLCAVFAFAVTTLAVVFFQQGALLIGAVAFAEPVAPRVVVGSILVVAASIWIAVTDIKQKRSHG